MSNPVPRIPRDEHYHPALVLAGALLVSGMFWVGIVWLVRLALS